MFPFQLSNDLENAISNISSDNYVNIVPCVSTAVLDKNVPVNAHLHLQPQPQPEPVKSSGKRGRPRKVPSSMKGLKVISDNDESGKKIVHREMERQRRREMTSLYTSLRSLLPLEKNRGKGSMCDHIAEATKYIRDMEKNIAELRDNKEKLKSSSNSSSSTNNLPRDLGSSTSNITTNCSPCSSTSACDYNVNVHTSSGETEIEISARVEEDCVFPISKVLHVLIQEGLNVVDCVSSKVNQRWIYILHCEVFDKVSIDSNQLQQRLMSKIGSSYGRFEP